MQLDQKDIDYPREIFQALIDGNSPYAFYLFQWVPYQTDAKRWRLKMLHDVKTFDGREAHGIWPNGNSCGPFKDDEVEFIRISKEQFGNGWKDPREPDPEEVAAIPEAPKYFEEIAPSPMDVHMLSKAQEKRDRKAKARAKNQRD